ncbi:MAG: CPBP family intramembrane metalloprotease [Flavobacteriaceae bacterium]
MLGLLVIIIVSWVLLRFIQRTNLDALGIVPNGKRAKQFLIGFLVMIFISLSTIGIESLVLKIDWKLNSSINYKEIFNAVIYHFKSALTEDLVFRGAILYILIQRIGAKKAMLLSALCFGIYHVFSYGITEGGIILITYVIVITGFVGYVWAYTFHKTRSILMALGIHIATNLINTFFFESNPYGELIFTKVSGIDLSGWNNLYFLIFKGLFPTILTLIFVKLYLRYSTKSKELGTSDKKTV